MKLRLLAHTMRPVESICTAIAIMKDKEPWESVRDLTQKEKDEIAHSIKYLRMAITPYYASLMDPDDSEDPVRKQAVPTSNELHVTKDEMEDTVFETVDSPHEGLTHRHQGFILSQASAMPIDSCTRDASTNFILNNKPTCSLM